MNQPDGPASSAVARVAPSVSTVVVLHSPTNPSTPTTASSSNSNNKNSHDTNVNEFVVNDVGMGMRRKYSSCHSNNNRMGNGTPCLLGLHHGRSAAMMVLIAVVTLLTTVSWIPLSSESTLKTLERGVMPLSSQRDVDVFAIVVVASSTPKQWLRYSTPQRHRHDHRRWLQSGGDGSDDENDVVGVDAPQDDTVEVVENSNDNDEMTDLVDFIEDVAEKFDGNDNSTVGQILEQALDEVLDINKNDRATPKPTVERIGPDNEPLPEIASHLPENGASNTNDDDNNNDNEPKAPFLVTTLMTAIPIAMEPAVSPPPPTLIDQTRTSSTTIAPVESPMVVAPPITTTTVSSSPPPTFMPHTVLPTTRAQNPDKTEGDDDIFDSDFYHKNHHRSKHADSTIPSTSFTILATLVGITAMIFTAWQMSDNPDGIFASLCRLILTCLQLFIRVVTSPCRKYLPCCFSYYNHSVGNGYHEPYGHMPVSTMDYGYKDPTLELS